MSEQSTSGDHRMMCERTDLFGSGEDGYHTYRIPALVVSKKGTLLAFCEGRRHGGGDSGEIDMVLKRSSDNGLTWEPMQVILSEPGMTCGNPCPVVDQSNGAILLPFNKNYADGGEGLIVQGKAPRTVWITRSMDDGVTWDEPVEITAAVKDPSWTWYATGPGHGIQLRNGRLVIPCDHVVGQELNASDPIRSHVIYSDDHGASWHIGGTVEERTDECAVVETNHGDLYLNCRNDQGDPRRTCAWSHDNGVSFSKRVWDDTLLDPICQGSLIRFTHEDCHSKSRVLFSNAASTTRERLTVRLSYDECETWPVSRVLHGGPAAYSDLAVAADMTICCLYECGEDHAYERLTLARFTLEWLTSGADTLRAKWRRYQELRPDELAEFVETSPIAFWPLGLLEHHGWQSPVGLDGLKAEKWCMRIAENTGGVILPTMWWGAGGGHGDFRWTHYQSVEAAEEILLRTLRQLIYFGFRVIVLLAGHYPWRRLILVKHLPTLQKQHPEILFLWGTEMDIGGDLDIPGDHGAREETSYALHLFPQWVDLGAMRAGRGLSAWPEGKQPTGENQHPGAEDLPDPESPFYNSCHPLFAQGGVDARMASAERGAAAVARLTNHLSAVIDDYLGRMPGK